MSFQIFRSWIQLGFLFLTFIAETNSSTILTSKKINQTGELPIMLERERNQTYHESTTTLKGQAITNKRSNYQQKLVRIRPQHTQHNIQLLPPADSHTGIHCCPKLCYLCQVHQVETKRLEHRHTLSILKRCRFHICHICCLQSIYKKKFTLAVQQLHCTTLSMMPGPVIQFRNRSLLWSHRPFFFCPFP